jgi:hypothetical protein
LARQFRLQRRPFTLHFVIGEVIGKYTSAQVDSESPRQTATLDKACADRALHAGLS